jgi:hypothetical protein
MLILDINYESPTVKAQKDHWRMLHSDVLLIINEILGVIMTPLCDTSPEGNIPEEYRDCSTVDLEVGEMDNSSPSNQLILSCCWRTLREARFVILCIALELLC